MALTLKLHLPVPRVGKDSSLSISATKAVTRRDDLQVGRSCKSGARRMDTLVGGATQPVLRWTNPKILEYNGRTKRLSSHQERWALSRFNKVLSYYSGSKSKKPDSLSLSKNCKKDSSILPPRKSW